MACTLDLKHQTAGERGSHCAFLPFCGPFRSCRSVVATSAIFVVPKASELKFIVSCTQLGELTFVNIQVCFGSCYSHLLRAYHWTQLSLASKEKFVNLFELAY